MGAARAGAPPGGPQGTRAVGSAGSLTLCGGRRRHRAWAARGSLAAGPPRSACQGSASRGSRGHGSGPIGGGISAAQKVARRGLLTTACLRGLVGGVPSSPPHPEIFLSVKTSRPLKAFSGRRLDSSVPDLGSPYPSKFWGVIKTRPWDLPRRRFKFLESEIR